MYLPWSREYEDAELWELDLTEPIIVECNSSAVEVNVGELWRIFVDGTFLEFVEIFLVPIDVLGTKYEDSAREDFV